MYDKKETLCITCRKACNAGCSWSAVLEPVEGWTAMENPRGYLVEECPEYVNDDDGSGRLEHIDKDGMMLLMEAVARQMREDYIFGKGPYDNKENRKRARKPMTYRDVRAANRKVIENWILHGQGKALLQLSNPEEVVQMLRILARRHDTEMARIGV